MSLCQDPRGRGRPEAACSLRCRACVSTGFVRRRLVSIWKIILGLPLLLPLVVCRDSRSQSPLTLLAEADRLAMLYNWPEAAPLYAQAESLFAQSADRKNALAARLGYVWATADAGVSPAITRAVAA